MNHHCKSMHSLAECSYIKKFQELFCTPKFFNKNTGQHKYLPSTPIQISNIIEFMGLDIFDDIYHDIIHGTHECTSLNISDLNFEVIKFLIQNNYISITNKQNTFYVIDIILNLFYEIQSNDVGKSRVKEYIDYFWNFIVENNKELIINHVDNGTGYTFENHINNCLDTSIKLEYNMKYQNIANKCMTTNVLEDAYVDSSFLVEVLNLQNNKNNEEDYIFAI